MDGYSEIATALTALERDLAERTAALAEVLARPASQRDPSKVEALWAGIAAMRPECEALVTKVRLIQRPRPGARTTGTMSEREYARKHRSAYSKSKRFLGRIEAWDEVERSVAQHIDPVSRPLLVPSPIGGLNALAHQVYNALHRLANLTDQDRQAHEDAAFPDIPMPLMPFDDLMRAAYRVTLALGPGQPRRFLDIGCGGGTKVFLASRYFERCDGLDLDSGYIAAAQSTLLALDAQECSAFQANAVEFDGYGDYDVIYFFRPMRDDALLDALEDRLMEQVRPGTVIIAPYGSDLKPRGHSRLPKFEGCISVTGLTDAEAKQLHQDAEATGTEIVRRSHMRSHPGFWAPLHDAASFGALQGP